VTPVRRGRRRRFVGARRPGRRQRLVASIGTALQLVGAGAVAAPQRVVAAVAGHAAGLAMMTASGVAGHLDVAYLQGGSLLVATVAAAVAAAVDRRELRAMAAVDLCGASALQRRLVVVVEGVLLGLVALPIGLVAGVVIGTAAGVDDLQPMPAALTAVLVPALVTLVAGRVRTRVAVVDAAADPVSDATARRRLDVLRVVVGVACVAVAVLLSRELRAFWELDILLGPLFVLAALGLVLALPPVVAAVGGWLSRARWVPVALAGSGLRERRRLLAPAAALGAVAAMVVAVQAVVGLGLAEREQARREKLGDPDRFTAGLSDSQVYVGRVSPIVTFLWAASRGGPSLRDGLAAELGVPDGAADAVRTAVPGARVAGIEALPADVVGDPLVPSALPYRVAVGTPELVAALGLERFTADLEAGRAVALDPSVVVAGQVTLTGGPLAQPQWLQTLPARLVQRRVVPQYVPRVLVPPSVAREVDARAGVPGDADPMPSIGLVVGRDRAFSADELAAVAAAVDRVPDPALGGSASLGVVPGGEPVGFALETNRLDSSYAIVLDSPDDVRLAVVVAVMLTLVALAVALRLAALTGRSDDELLDVLGARAATLRRAAVAQALVLGLLAVPLGAAVGVVAARLGLDAYNGRGRFADGVELPPIPFGVPAALVVGALVVPLAAALVAGLLAHRHRPVDPQALADRLAW
jgi:hypothetical protein